jgi:hypothetical protein
VSDARPRPVRPPRSRSGGLEGLIDQITDIWKLSTRSSRQMLDGTYSLGDASQDFNRWLTSSATYVVSVADDFWGESAPTSTYNGVWRARATVLPGLPRPLKLYTTGLVGINQPSAIVSPANVTFDPPTLQDNHDEFDVIVTIDPALRGIRTILFQGVIRGHDPDDEPAEDDPVVTDPVVANNLDGGPVR